MNEGKTVFAQVMDWIHEEQFQRCVLKYEGDYKVRNFSCRDQFLCMAYAQVTFRESLRDIEACLNSRPEILYHMGFRCGRVHRSTLADANESRDWRMYESLARILIRKARKLYADQDLGIEFRGAIYALDSTTIDLCLSLFPWADFRSTKAGIKLHTLLDLRGSIPSIILITEAKPHDQIFLDVLVFEPGALYIMDRGYVDFEKLFEIEKAKAFFLTRAKEGMRFYVVESYHVDKITGLRCDQMIRLTGFYPRKKYPDALRRVKFYDEETKQVLIFLTNNFKSPALDIARLYKMRWKIELFFKWIKGNLRIKTFFGNSDNAVRTQIWIAVCVYVLAAIIKKQLSLKQNLSTILQIFSVNAFERIPLPQLFANIDLQTFPHQDDNQLSLFNL
jgi:hypothetical protein